MSQLTPAKSRALVLQHTAAAGSAWVRASFWPNTSIGNTLNVSAQRHLEAAFRELRARVQSQQAALIRLRASAAAATPGPVAQPVAQLSLFGEPVPVKQPQRKAQPVQAEMFRGSEVLHVGVTARPQLSVATPRGSIALVLEMQGEAPAPEHPALF